MRLKVLLCSPCNWSLILLVRIHYPTGPSASKRKVIQKYDLITTILVNDTVSTQHVQ